MSYVSEVLADAPIAWWRLNERGYNRQAMALTPDAFWKMDEASGNLVDSSGNGKTATKNGTPTYGLAGPISDGLGAISVNGSTDYFDAGNNFGYSGTAAFSCAFWFYKTAVQATVYENAVSKISQVGSNNGWRVQFFPLSDGAAGKLSFSRILNNVEKSAGFGTAYPLNQWNLVVVTYDGANMKCYLNGVLGQTTADTSSLTSNAGTFQIGRGFGVFFTGQIARVETIGRALSAAEVAALYAARIETDPTVSNVAADSSGNGRSAVYGNGSILAAGGTLGDGTTAMSTNGKSDLFRANDDVVFAGDFSIEFWLKTTAPNIQSENNARLVNRSSVTQGFDVLLTGLSSSQSSWTLEFDVGNQTLKTGIGIAPITALIDGHWHHVVCVRIGTTGFIYIDGVLVKTGSIPGDSTLVTGGATMTIGSIFALRWLNGSMDEVAIYDKGLSATRVAAHRFAGIGLNASVAAAATASAALTTAVMLAAAVGWTVTAAADLLNGIILAAAAAIATNSAAGELTTEILFTAVVVAINVVSGDLNTAIRLAGAPAVAIDVNADLRAPVLSTETGAARRVRVPAPARLVSVPVVSRVVRVPAPARIACVPPVQR